MSTSQPDSARILHALVQLGYITVSTPKRINSTPKSFAVTVSTKDGTLLHITSLNTMYEVARAPLDRWTIANDGNGHVTLSIPDTFRQKKTR
jgi:hypothetical protein